MEYPRVLSPDPLCWAFVSMVVTMAIKCIRVGNPNSNVHWEPHVERQFGHTNQDCNAEPLSIVQTSLVSTLQVYTRYLYFRARVVNGYKLVEEMKDQVDRHIKSRDTPCV